MTAAIILFIAIFVIYQLVKPKGPRVPKATAFDLFLMEQYKQSKIKADAIPTIQPNSIIPEVETEDTTDNEFIEELYLGMIDSGKYDTLGLRKEACQALHITEVNLDIMLAKYKSKKRKSKYG